MKKTFTILLLVILLVIANAFSNGSYAQSKKNNSTEENDDLDKLDDGKLPEGFTHDDKIHYLEMQCLISEPIKDKGKISSNEVPVVLFRIYDDKGALVKAVFADEKGKCNFRLGFQRKYKVILSKRGFYSKTITIDTKIPSDLNTAYTFPADITFLREQPKLDAKVFKDPVAIIVYSEKTKQFEYDMLYSKKLSFDLKKVNDEYLKLLK